jgi:DNA-binding NtrC family response regulator
MASYFLSILHHDGAEEIRELHDGTWEVGRAPGIWLAPLDPSLSRLHVRLSVSGREIVLEALPSRNGTRVNGVPVEGLLSLFPGDEILAGRTLLKLGEGTPEFQRRRMQRTVELRPDSGTEPVFVSDAMKTLVEKARRLARSPISVLIAGETGTGKEVVARLLHDSSPRAAGPFVVVNCPALPAGLVESELFGVEGGVATGVTAREGLLEKADGGTLLLDEVGDLPLDVQPKLLRFLQERTVQKVGGRRAVTLDVRVLSATHRDLRAAAAEGRFRQDLFFRLSGATLDVPPLRDRPDDILPLARSVLARCGPDRGLGPDAEAALLSHDWPGNVREVLAVVERAVHLVDGIEIRASDLDLPSPEGLLRAAEPGSASGQSVAELLDRIVEGRADFWEAVYEPYRRRELPKATLRSFVGLALSRSGGGVVELSRLLRTETRYRKLLDFLRNAELLPGRDDD